MSQNWLDDCFSTAHIVETDMTQIENNFAALKSLFSGSSAPPNPADFQLWANTSDSIIYVRCTGSSWHTFFDVANDRVAAGKVDGVSIKTSAILSSNFGATCIKAVAVDGSAITETKIADGAVTAGKLMQFSSGASYKTNYGYLTSYPNGGEQTLCSVFYVSGGKVHCITQMSVVGGHYHVVRDSSVLATITATYSVTEVDLPATGNCLVTITVDGTGCLGNVRFVGWQAFGTKGGISIPQTGWGSQGAFGTDTAV